MHYERQPDTSADVDVPILNVRGFLRKHQQYGFVEADLHEAFGATLGARLFRALFEGKYVELLELHREQRYGLTVTGGRLARAGAGKGFARKTADRALVAFVDRCREVRDNEDYLYKVRTALLFGSMLTDKPVVGDVDIAVEVVPKRPGDPNIVELSLAQAREAMRQGRCFSSYFEELSYAQDRVLRFLKSRSPVLQLHRHDDGVLRLCKSRVIYEDDRADAPKPRGRRSRSKA